MKTDLLATALFNQVDESSTTPLSIRLPNILVNELDELSLTLDKSRSFLINEYIKDGIRRTHELIQERTANAPLNDERDPDDFTKRKVFILNTNYSNNPDAHFEMIKNQEAAAFVTGWKHLIKNLCEGDKVYLYQSGVGFVASGKVTGDLIIGDYKGVAEEKYSKKLADFKTGFKAITAKEFKDATGKGTNFRATLSEMSLQQGHKLDELIKNRM
ncbi:CopG family ribbon-helix-helix protein [Acinetobacter lactucae]|uniref:CopG family ribbon-helix-helix protein n=1 Tax=Acinetobacter lactucae TaxID=1785128 RepID=UPI0034D19E9F